MTKKIDPQKQEMLRGHQKENLYLKRDVLQRDDELDSLVSGIPVVSTNYEAKRTDKQDEQGEVDYAKILDPRRGRTYPDAVFFLGLTALDGANDVQRLMEDIANQPGMTVTDARNFLQAKGYKVTKRK